MMVQEILKDPCKSFLSEAYWDIPKNLVSLIVPGRPGRQRLAHSKLSINAIIIIISIATLLLLSPQVHWKVCSHNNLLRCVILSPFFR